MFSLRRLLTEHWNGLAVWVAVHLTGGTLQETELMHLADALEEETFEAGEMIFKQGDAGEKFYLVKSVRCSARS